MKLLIYGGQNYTDDQMVRSTLESINPTRVIHCIEGPADQVAAQWAQENGVATQRHASTPDQDNPRQAKLQQQQLLEHTKPDMIVVFPGAWINNTMLNLAREMGLAVREVVDLESPRTWCRRD